MSTPAKGNEVPFSFFVELVQAIAAVKPHRATEKQPRFTRYVDNTAYKTFKRWAGALQERYSLPAGGTAMIFRMLFPEEDIRRKYGMQEPRLAQCVTKILGVSSAPKGRGHRLKNWKGGDALGCLGNEVATVMAGSSTVYTSSISLARVDALLAELAGTCPFSADATRISAPTTQRSKDAILTALYATLTPSEGAVVTQIILKDLRPLLYPIPPDASHYTSALLEYKSNAVATLPKEAAMHAWDPSGRLSFIFRTRANLEEATLAYEGFANGEGFPQPTVGVPIQIPKCVKGQGPAHTLRTLQGADKVWMETKYDGERAQIHVWLDENGSPHIRIFSKSGRDSTMDRAGIHAIIYDALGIVNPETLGDGEDEVLFGTPSFEESIVVEAEMVAYSHTLERIDEFWRIRSLIARTAIGVRHRSPPPYLLSTQLEDMDTQCSLVSNGSDGGSRHLALVFFDVLLIDNDSLLSQPYGERRKILEQVVHAKPGYAMLAERTCIDTSRADAEETLRRAFASAVADHQEGVVIKADLATYAERRLPWVKLKQDYIPGHGDTVDLVLLGASWEKDRARELRVPPTAYTTFYFGALSNADDLKEYPTRLPHFEIIFTSSYGLDRAQLEEMIFTIKNSDPAAYGHTTGAGLPYTCKLRPGLSPPTVLLRRPVLAELYGAGFTKSPGARVYELRFPRIGKIYRPSDRPWIDGMPLPEFQEVARVAVGRDRHGKAEHDWARAVFRPDDPPSPGVRCPAKRRRVTDMWVERLETIDARIGTRSPTKKARVEGASTARRVAPNADQENDRNQGVLSTSAAAITPVGQGHRPAILRLESVTNVASSSVPLAGPSMVRPLSPSPQQPHKEPSLPGPSNRHKQAAPSSSPPPDDANDMPHRNPDIPSDTQSATPGPLLKAVSEGAAKGHPTTSAPLSHDVGGDTKDVQPPTAPSLTIKEFLEDCIVYLNNWLPAPRPAWRAASKDAIPTGNNVSSLDTFLFACGLEEGSPACGWARCGVVFVADGEGDRTTYTIGEIAMTRASVINRNGAARCKPILVLSMKALAHDRLQETATAEEWEARAICRFG
ncbi:hypothetical protein C2E23DRAFT_877883 [Lenzites betulinus]|nr:hypothetical protein C2E23DRAFT_877883 [Lenzites betulinus]